MSLKNLIYNMTWWSDFFDSMLFLNTLRFASFNVFCLSTLSFFKLERAFMHADLFRELLALGFWYRSLTVDPLIVFRRGSLFIFLVSRPYTGLFADYWIFFWIDLGRSTWSDLLCCIPVFGCTWVRSNLLCCIPVLFI